MPEDDFDWGPFDDRPGVKGPPPSAHGGAGNFNSLKHGLYAREVVLPGEDRAEYDTMYLELQDEFEPRGRFELNLVRRLTDISWRLGRSAAIEAGVLGPDMQGNPRPRHIPGYGPLIATFQMALNNASLIDRMGRQEARLERAFDRTIRALERRQARRLKRDGKP
jgi:hypothetical protein